MKQSLLDVLVSFNSLSKEDKELFFKVVESEKPAPKATVKDIQDKLDELIKEATKKNPTLPWDKQRPSVDPNIWRGGYPNRPWDMLSPSNPGDYVGSPLPIPQRFTSDEVKPFMWCTIGKND